MPFGFHGWAEKILSAEGEVHDDTFSFATVAIRSSLAGTIIESFCVRLSPALSITAPLYSVLDGHGDIPASMPCSAYPPSNAPTAGACPVLSATRLGSAREAESPIWNAGKWSAFLICRHKSRSGKPQPGVVHLVHRRLCMAD